MSSGPVPRNLTARSSMRIAGNPVDATFDSTVANCFPGLEFDVRSLDRRFFPGLLFDFIPAPWTPDPKYPKNPQGARLAYVDFRLDPMLPETSDIPWVQTLITAYAGSVGATLGSGRWFLQWVEQSGTRIQMVDQSTGLPYDGTMVWRLVRALLPDPPLTIALVARDDSGRTTGGEIVLQGYRRRYVNSAGVFDEAYQPGEFTDSMCVPWTHDFRDCGCHYWAANHPDIVLGVLPDSLPSDPDQLADSDVFADAQLDWLRSVRGAAGNAPAAATIEQNRTWQLDHFEINRVWEQLPFVLEGREIGAFYARGFQASALGYKDMAELIHELETVLAPTEHTVALQYLYALFSLKAPDEAPQDKWPSMAGDLLFARQTLLQVAAGEMTHLRWANQLLWRLHAEGYYPPGKTYEPALGIIGIVPGEPNDKLRPLEPETLDGFILLERPGGPLDGIYCRCTATLKGPEFKSDLFELAVRIDTDGLDHERRFRDMRLRLQQYGGAAPWAYLRDIRMGTPEETGEALDLYKQILANLREAYLAEFRQDMKRAQQCIGESRQLMDRLFSVGEALARSGIGLPFHTVFAQIAQGVQAS